MLRPFDPDNPPHSPNDRFTGYAVDLAAALSRTIGFDYVIKVVGDDKYGNREENGTWNGMIGELLRGVSRLTLLLLTRILSYIRFPHCSLVYESQYAE